MRIFQSFLVLIFVAILWLVPYSSAIYAFRTDVREDTFTITTAPAETTTTLTLKRPVYNDDDETISVISDNSADTPVIDSYTAATRALVVTGLIDDDTRIITAFYDVPAFTVHSALDVLMDILPFFIILILVALPVVALIMIWKFNRV